MSAGLFSSTSYNRLGISLLLLLRPEGPEGRDSFGSKKGEKLARITELTPKYSDEQGGVDVATEKVDLTTLSKNVKSLLRLYKNPEVEYGQVVFFQKTMEAFERVVVESEQKTKIQTPQDLEKAKDLINIAKQKLLFTWLQALINGIEFWLGILEITEYATKYIILIIGCLRVDLVGFRQKSQEISSFLENSPQLTEDFKKRAKRILAKSKEVIGKLEEFLEKGKENLIQLRPDLQPEIDKLPALVADVKKIVEDIDNSLGLTTEVTGFRAILDKIKGVINDLSRKGSRR